MQPIVGLCDSYASNHSRDCRRTDNEAWLQCHVPPATDPLLARIKAPQAGAPCQAFVMARKDFQIVLASRF